HSRKILNAASGSLAPSANRRHEQDVQVEENRPVADVVKIVPQPFFQTRVTAPAVNLRISRESSPDGVALIVIGVFLAKSARELRSLRPRADETHVTAEDIPKLRKLIEARTAKIKTNSGTARIG